MNKYSANWTEAKTISKKNQSEQWTQLSQTTIQQNCHVQSLKKKWIQADQLIKWTKNATNWTKMYKINKNQCIDQSINWKYNKQSQNGQ